MSFFRNNDNSLGTTMLVNPVGYGSTGNDFGGAWWLILLVLLMGGGLWGGMGGLGMMGGLGGMWNGMGLYPWMNQAEITSQGFANQANGFAISDLRNAVSAGFGDVQLGIAGVNQNICQTGNGIQQALCQGFAGTTAAVTGAQNAVTQQLYSNEIANLNRSFAEQSANTAGFTSVNTGVADLKYTMAAEAAATRANCDDNNQKILDKLCQLELDGVRNQLAQAQRENVGLQNALNMANLSASQTAQDARIINGVYDRLSQCPVGTMPVYGNSPIFACPQTVNSGCGCGNNGLGFAA